MEDWQGIAEYLGYPDEASMYQDLYTDKGLSCAEIGRRVGTNSHTVLRRLKILKVEIRSQGGNNATPRLRMLLHRLDQRLVFATGNQAVANMIQGSSSLVYKYKRGIKGGGDGFRPDSANRSAEPVFGE